MALVVATLIGLGSGSARASSDSRTLTLFSAGSAEQFLDHSDDRARGEGNNPFGAFADTPAVAEPGSNGPFAGDQAIYQLKLYRNAGLTQKVGTAVFSCLYNFNHNAYCDVVFDVSGSGSLIAAGDFSFDATHFNLAITGGLRKFKGESGSVTGTQAAHHAQRLVFSLK